MAGLRHADDAARRTREDRVLALKQLCGGEAAGRHHEHQADVFFTSPWRGEVAGRSPAGGGGFFWSPPPGGGEAAGGGRAGGGGLFGARVTPPRTLRVRPSPSGGG